MTSAQVAIICTDYYQIISSASDWDRTSWLNFQSVWRSLGLGNYLPSGSDGETSMRPEKSPPFQENVPTLPETNSLPLKTGLPKITFHLPTINFQWLNFCASCWLAPHLNVAQLENLRFFSGGWWSLKTYQDVKTTWTKNCLLQIMFFSCYIVHTLFALTHWARYHATKSIMMSDFLTLQLV